MDCYRCLIQWGFTNNTGRPYITFPFKFSNVFTAISCICHNGSPSEANTVYNVSISGMNIGASGGGSGKYWCAFGVAQQQWGYCSSRTATFPIPFPASALFIVAVPKTTSTSATATGAEYLGTTSVNLYLHELRVGISQAAIEQWGYSNSTGVTFPIAFKECYAVVSNAHSNTTGNTDHYHLLSWTSTGAAFGYWNMSFYGTLYIALGVE